jgi:hypothetical protein
MTFAESVHRPGPVASASRGSARLPAPPGEPQGAGLAGLPAGLGGNTVAQVVESHCPAAHRFAGVVIEHLDAQAGTWQCSTDDGRTWRAVRTDLINRPGNTGLALDRDARLRVLPFGGHRVQGARVAFHTVQRSHAEGNGSYRAYAADDREDGSRTVTVVLELSAINGAPPAVHVPRLRNKRSMVRTAAQVAACASASPSGGMVMA